MARNDMTVVQLQALKDQRERDDRAAVASGNVDENSALYRHAKLSGWNMGDEPFHGQAGRKWYAAEQAAKGRMMDARADIMEADADLRAGFDSIVANANAQRLDRTRRGRATLGSIVGHAMDNNGMVPAELAPSVGIELGQPGFVGGTLTKDGTFMSLGRGKNGSIQPTGLVSPLNVEKAMVASGDYKNAMKFYNGFLNGNYTPEQIESATGFSKQWLQGAVNADVSDKERKFQLECLKVLTDMDAHNKSMTSAADFFSRNPKLAEFFASDYKRDENGNVVLTENPATGEMEPTRVPLSPEQAAENSLKYFEGLRRMQANGGASQMSEFQREFLNVMRSMSAPAAKDPNTVAMNQRAARRANVIDAAGGRQSLVIRRDLDGRETYTNGYVVDGRVYDVNGDPLEGEFFDERMRPIKPASPSVPAPVSELDGAQGGGSQSVASQYAAQALRQRQAQDSGAATSTTQVNDATAGASAQSGAGPLPPLGASATQAQAQQPTQAQYGLRNDGKTYKGTGWLGALELPNGGVASEYTVGVNINGEEMDIPTLVPTLTKDEQSQMVNDIIPNNKPVPDAILRKAVDFAKMRIQNGQSVFANDGQPTQAAPSAPEQKPTRQFDEEQLRKRRNGIKADFVRRYKTVQDVARDVVRTLNANGELDSVVNPDGTRRTDLTPQEESDIIYNVRQKFRDAGMSDFWDREVAGISPNSPGGLTRKAILDRLFRDWNNRKAPLEYGNRRIQAQ